MFKKPVLEFLKNIDWFQSYSPGSFGANLDFIGLHQMSRGYNSETVQYFSKIQKPGPQAMKGAASVKISAHLIII